MIDNSKMMIGEHFTYRGIEWICLDIIDGNYPNNPYKSRNGYNRPHDS